MSGDLLSLAQVAELRRLNYWQVAHAIRGGGLPSRTVGRTRFVTRADAEAWPGPAPRGGRRPATKPQDAPAGSGAQSCVACASKAAGRLLLCPEHDYAPAGAWVPEPVAGHGETREPVYAPAIIRLLAGGTCPADVLVDISGAPEVGLVDFGILKAQWSGGRDAAGRFIFREV